MVRFLFDECISHRIVDELKIMGYDVSSVGSALPRGSKDEDVLGWCHRHDAVLVTKDYKIKRTKQYLPQLRNTGVSIAFIRPPRKGWKYQKEFQWFLGRIDQVEADFQDRSPRYLRYSTSRLAPEQIWPNLDRDS